jgi:outer membrane protein OmpA-like peptidoglycan-associated protein
MMSDEERFAEYQAFDDKFSSRNYDILQSASTPVMSPEGSPTSQLHSYHQTRTLDRVAEVFRKPLSSIEMDFTETPASSPVLGKPESSLVSSQKVFAEEPSRPDRPVLVPPAAKSDLMEQDIPPAEPESTFSDALPVLVAPSPAEQKKEAIVEESSPVVSDNSRPEDRVSGAPQSSVTPDVMASLTPSAVDKSISSTGTVSEYTRVLFSRDSAELPADSMSSLKKVADYLNANPRSRVQLKAYAGVGDGDSNRARRVSLTRALTIRSSLMQMGVESTRMDVRALGMPTDGGPENRVDIEVSSSS